MNAYIKLSVVLSKRQNQTKVMFSETLNLCLQVHAQSETVLFR